MVKKVKKSTQSPKLADSQIKKAFKAVKDLIISSRNTKDLLSDEHEFINMQVEVNHLPEIATLRCVPIPLPHAIYDKKFNSQVMLIVKDPQRAMKEKLDGLGLKDTPLTKIIGISKLGKNYTQYKDRRELIRQYDLFLADIRVFNMLPDRLGKYFYEKKKIPCLLNLDDDVEATLRRAMSSTFIIAAKGPIFCIKIARSSMSEKEVMENVQAAIEALPNAIPGLERQHIRRIEIKGQTTMALPVYNFLSEEEIQAYKN
ncbi:unnamed protein product [Blepharisma stoltei]|uniref:Ribosomal protein L1 n=1 Tax=Blepharisma stoltei TaxID=1481888 RepID=A0AAU9KC26_9CILI|nr:unnamed protein product [Blepharisma stoltei]